MQKKPVIFLFFMVFISFGSISGKCPIESPIEHIPPISAYNNEPSISFLTPSTGAKIRLSPLTLMVSVIDVEDEIVNVEYRLTSTGYDSGRIELPYLSSNTYRALVHFSTLKTAVYRITVYATDNGHEGDPPIEVSKYIDVTLAYQVHVIKEIDDIEYQVDGVEARGSTPASCIVEHDGDIENTEFLLTLPEEFSDANNYQIFRGNTIIQPNGFTVSTHITDWSLPSYADSDQVFFTIRTPYLTEEAPSDPTFDENRYMTIEQVFYVTSLHYFTNIKTTFRPQQGFDGLYNWTLYYKMGYEWFEVGAEYEFEASKPSQFLYEITFNIPLLAMGESIMYKLVGVEQPRSVTRLEPYLYGLAGAVIVALIWIIVSTIGGDANPSIKDRWEDSKFKYWGVTIGLVVGSFVIIAIITYYTIL